MYKLHLKINKFIISFLFILIFSLSLIYGFVLYQESRENQISNKLVQLGLIENRVENGLKNMDYICSKLSSSLKLSALLLSNNQWLIYKEKYKLNYLSGYPQFRDILDYTKGIDLIYLQDKEGNEYAKSEGELLKNSHPHLVKRMKKEQKPFVSKPYFSAKNQKPVISLIYPIFDKKKQFIGSVGIDLCIPFFNTLLNDIYSSQKDKILISDSQGYVLFDTFNHFENSIININSQTIITSSPGPIEKNRATYKEQKIKYNELPYSIAQISQISKQKKAIKLGGKWWLLLTNNTLKDSSSIFAVMAIENSFFNKFWSHNFFMILLSLLILSLPLSFLLHYTISFYLTDPITYLLTELSKPTFKGSKSLIKYQSEDYSAIADTFYSLQSELQKSYSDLEIKVNALAESRRDYHLLSLFTQKLAREDNSFSLFLELTKMAKSISRAQGGAFYLIDKDKQNINLLILSYNRIERTMSYEARDHLYSPISLENKKSLCFKAIESQKIKYLNFDESIKDDIYLKDLLNITPIQFKRLTFIPIINFKGEPIALLVLVNEKHNLDEQELKSKKRILASLASHVGGRYSNVKLYKEINGLFESFMKSIATTMDSKSDFTAGHIKRVVELTTILIDEINLSQNDTYKNIHFSKSKKEEILFAAWMHDIGKITTPINLLEKSSKLSTHDNGIDKISERFHFLMELTENTNSSTLSKKKLQDDLAFINRCNNPDNPLSDEDIKQLNLLKNKKITIQGETKTLISDQEVEKLSIKQGTLTNKERKKVEEHALITLKILNKLNFPPHLKNIPDYAAMHHECLDGSGYPRGLKAEEIPLEARIIAIADIFEALTAKDRPYREAIPLSKAIQIMENKVEKRHIDKELYKLLRQSDKIKSYINAFLDQSQIDIEF